MRHLGWIVFGAALFGFGCGGGDEAPGPIASAELLSASGTFSVMGGELELSLKPLDEQHRFTKPELAVEALGFTSVFLTPVELERGRLPVRTRATEVAVDENAERMLVRGTSEYGLASSEIASVQEVSGYLEIRVDHDLDPVRTHFSFATSIVE
jgi:hypothetical protein